MFVFSSNRKRRRPTCQRCKVHDEVAPVKSHKYYCKYKYCACEKCALVTKQRKVMANQVWLLRQQKVDQVCKNGSGNGKSPKDKSGDDGNSVGSKVDSPTTPGMKSPSIPIEKSPTINVMKSPSTPGLKSPSIPGMHSPILTELTTPPNLGMHMMGNNSGIDCNQQMQDTSNHQSASNYMTTLLPDMRSFTHHPISPSESSCSSNSCSSSNSSPVTSNAMENQLEDIPSSLRPISLRRNNSDVLDDSSLLSDKVQIIPPSSYSTSYNPLATAPMPSAKKPLIR